MTVLALGQKTSAKLNKRHRTIVQWAEFMIDKVRRWQPEREITLVGDGSYAAIVLVQRCQRLKKRVKLVSRLRLDARLFDFPAPQPKSKRGPKPKKGTRQTQLSQRLEDPETNWKKLKVILYGKEHFIEFITGISLWHTPGQDPVAYPLGAGALPRRQLRTRCFLLLRYVHFCQADHLSGLLCAGISKSPSKNYVLSSVSRPNANGLTAPSNAPRLVSLASSAW